MDNGRGGVAAVPTLALDRVDSAHASSCHPVAAHTTSSAMTAQAEATTAVTASLCGVSWQRAERSIHAQIEPTRVEFSPQQDRRTGGRRFSTTLCSRRLISQHRRPLVAHTRVLPTQPVTAIFATTPLPAASAAAAAMSDWECDKCTYLNSVDDLTCTMCFQVRASTRALPFTWQWLAQVDWIPYDAPSNEQIEAAFKAGLAKVHLTGV